MLRSTQPDDECGTVVEHWQPLYTSQALKDVLEQAAQVCESEYENWDNERPLRICATEIRKMIGEIK